MDVEPESDSLVSAWERHKFETENRLREREIELSYAKLKAEGRRNIMIGAMVPIILAIVTALPAYQQSIRDRLLKQAEFEAALITNFVQASDAEQAKRNLWFLVQTGLVEGATGSSLRNYLETNTSGGRVLPWSQ